MAIEEMMKFMQEAIGEVKESLARQEDRLAKVEVAIVKQDERISSALKRIDEQTELTKGIHKIASSVEIINDHQKTMMEKISETNKRIENISTDVEELKLKPAKRWDTIVVGVLSAVVSCIATYVFVRLGLK